jgi:hypothetical protein
MIVIASIHQPSTSTLLLFDNVLLLSEGKTAYYGSPVGSIQYFTSKGYTPPPMRSPAEFMLELTNFHFTEESNKVERLNRLTQIWQSSFERRDLENNILMSQRIDDKFSISDYSGRGGRRSIAMQTAILLHRMVLVATELNLTNCRNPIETLLLTGSELPCTSDSPFSWGRHGFGCRTHKKIFKMFLIVYSLVAHS